MFAYFQGDSLRDALKNSFEHTRGQISSLCFLMAEESCSEEGNKAIYKIYIDCKL